MPGIRRAFTLALAALACMSCEEFSPTLPAIVSVQPIDWPTALVLTDTVELEARIQDDAGTVITGLALEWESSNEAVLQILPPEAPDSASRSSELGARLTARAVAVGTGTSQVRAFTNDSKAFAFAEFRDTITVNMKWISITAGHTHSCGITVQHDAYCWGDGLLGNGSSSGSFVPDIVVLGLKFEEITAGWAHTCASLFSGGTFCWGRNTWGALGIGSTADQLAPVPVTQGPTFQSLSAGFTHTCGVSDISTGVCWGDNRSGQLGSPDATDTCNGSDPCSTTPIAVRSNGGTPLPLSEMSAGQISTCAIMSDNTGHCWGSNAHGTLGNDALADTAVADTAIAVSGGLTFRAISVGWYHACGVTIGGAVYCWGTNMFGELGVASVGDTCSGLVCSKAPVLVNDSLPFVAISVKERNTCAIVVDGAAYCWGLNDHGQLGTQTGETCSGLPCAREPIPVSGGFRFTRISVGQSHACGVTSEGSAFCWGDGRNGRLGNNGVTDSDQPVRVADPS